MRAATDGSNNIYYRKDETMAWKDLEDKFHEVIQQCCQTEEDKEGAIKYFAQMTVEVLIDDALEE